MKSPQQQEAAGTFQPPFSLLGSRLLYIYIYIYCWEARRRGWHSATFRVFRPFSRPLALVYVGCVLVSVCSVSMHLCTTSWFLSQRRFTINCGRATSVSGINFRLYQGQLGQSKWAIVNAVECLLQHNGLSVNRPALDYSRLDPVVDAGGRSKPELRYTIPKAIDVE